MEFNEDQPYLVERLTEGRAVVRFAPLCDHARTRQHEDELTMLIETCQAVACDLSQTALIASDWLRWLARMQAKATATGKIFGVAGMRQNVLVTADVLGLADRLKKAESVEGVWKL